MIKEILLMLIKEAKDMKNDNYKMIYILII
jgi:hypothetical protein